MRPGGEEWRKVPGLPPHYEVSNRGRARSLHYIDRRGWKRKPKWLNPKSGRIWLSIEGRSVEYPLAALILRAFVGPPPKGKYLSRHLDDNRENNKLSNLAWGDDQDNHDDAIRNGASFASYGRLGKPCSPETKEKIRAALRGRKTGRVISLAHREALRLGYERWRAR